MSRTGLESGFGHRCKRFSPDCHRCSGLERTDGSKEEHLELLYQAPSARKIVCIIPSLSLADYPVLFDCPLHSDSQGTSYTCDLYSKIPYASLDEAVRDRLWDDGLHLTEEGYNLMGDVIAERLIEILREQVNENVAPTSTN